MCRALRSSWTWTPRSALLESALLLENSRLGCLINELAWHEQRRVSTPKCLCSSSASEVILDGGFRVERSPVMSPLRIWFPKRRKWIYASAISEAMSCAYFDVFDPRPWPDPWSTILHICTHLAVASRVLSPSSPHHLRARCAPDTHPPRRASVPACAPKQGISRIYTLRDPDVY